ncbi:MAG: carboxypeptidase regulatory-like domain-containing protein [Vicinamibacterales bacterium]
MRSLWRCLLLVVLAASACGKSSPTAPTSASTSPANTAATRVVSLGGSLNFGAVEIGKTSELTLTIGNSGTGVLSVTGITCPGGYTPNWTSGTLAPGASQQVTVRFAPVAAQSYDGLLTVHGDHTAGTNTAPLSGSGAERAPARATLAGTATEQGAGVLSGATIEIRDGPDARTWTTTDEGGRFTLAGLQPGDVTVRASKSGYTDTDQRITLAAGAVAAIDFTVPKAAASAPPPPAPLPPPPTTPTPPPAPAPGPTAYDDEILQLVNNHRLSIGKPALVKSQVIWEQANGHSRNMASGAVPFGHDGFDARAAAIRAALGSGGSAAENVAMGFSSAAAVVNAWLGSAGHRANIEGNSTRTGISAAKSSGGVWYYTQMFY